ncbi:MAG TPA: flavin reductase family protein [Acidobacteriota bacterium]|nr:flavin reductase family protein [Acidobacteriota bacterium]
MEVNPKDYISIIAPPPVVLVSTLFGKVKNVAPYGMVMPVSNDPPLLALGIRKTRDTFKNIMDSKEFVVAYPSPELVEQIDQSAQNFPRNISEFEKTGLTPIQSTQVKPFRIKECQVNLECQLEWHKPAGDHHVVVGQVKAADIEGALYRKELRRAMIHPVYDAGHHQFRYAQKGPLIK